MTDRRTDLTFFLGALAGFSAAIALLHEPDATYDGAQYLRMAAHPLADTPAPYLTRLLVPGIVTVLPMSARLGFMVVTAVALALSAVLLRRLLVAVGCSERQVVAGVFVFAGTAASISVRSPYLIDASSFALLLAALLATVTHRWWWLVVVLPLAFLARDSIVGLAAPAIVVEALRVRARPAPIIAAGAATAVVAWLVMFTGLVFGTPPPRFDNFTADNIRAVLDYEQQFGSLPRVIVSTIVFTFGALWVAPLIAHRRLRGVRLALVASAAVTILLTPFVTDWLRSLSFTFPLVALAAVELDDDGTIVGPVVLAALAALLNYGVQPMSPGAAKTLFELALLAAEGLVIARLAIPSRVLHFNRIRPHDDAPLARLEQ